MIGNVIEEFVVMPNHIHGILIVDKEYSWDGHEKPENDCEGENACCEDPLCRDVAMQRLYMGDHPKIRFF